MTAPETLTPAECRAAVHADLAHAVGIHMEPDPSLSFRVDLGVGRRAATRAARKRNDNVGSFRTGDGEAA